MAKKKIWDTSTLSYGPGTDYSEIIISRLRLALKINKVTFKVVLELWSSWTCELVSDWWSNTFLICDPYLSLTQTLPSCLTGSASPGFNYHTVGRCRGPVQCGEQWPLCAATGSQSKVWTHVFVSDKWTGSSVTGPTVFTLSWLFIMQSVWCVWGGLTWLDCSRALCYQISDSLSLSLPFSLPHTHTLFPTSLWQHHTDPRSYKLIQLDPTPLRIHKDSPAAL